MTSIRTSEISSFILRTAYQFRLLPYNGKVVRTKKGGYRMRYFPEPKWHRIQRIVMVSLDASFHSIAGFIGIWWDVINPDLGIIERLLFYMVLCVDFMAVFMLLLLNLVGAEFGQMSDMFARMDHHLRKLHGKTGKEKDGAEVYMKAFLIMATIVTSSVPLVNFGLVEAEVHVFGLLKMPFFVGSLGFAFGGVFCIFQSWVLVLVAMNAGIIYTNSTLRWLNVLRWEPGMEAGRKDQLIGAYRIHQCMHNIAMKGMDMVVAVALSSASILMIIILVTVIGFSVRVGPVITVTFGITFIITVVATRLLLNLSTYLTDCSKEFPATFLQNDWELNQIQRMALLASPPLLLKVGPFSVISRDTFPSVMSDVVVEQTVDILLGMNEA